MKQFICMKWGTLYGPEYANRLYSMIARQVSGPFRLVCLTDDPRGVREEIQCHPCPEVAIPAPYCKLGWRKISLWAERVADLEGEVLFLDLDIVITGSLDCFFEFGQDFCVIRNWTQPKKRIGNTSVYRFTVGSHPYLLENFLRDQKRILAECPNEQTYVSENISTMTFWPHEWCRSFKVHCIPKGLKRWFVDPVLPAGTRIVAFTGRPMPDEAIRGQWPAPWYKRLHKHCRPCSWVAEHWQ